MLRIWWSFLAGSVHLQAVDGYICVLFLEGVEMNNNQNHLACSESSALCQMGSYITLHPNGESMCRNSAGCDCCTATECAGITVGSLEGDPCLWFLHQLKRKCPLVLHKLHFLHSHFLISFLYLNLLLIFKVLLGIIFWSGKISLFV